MENRDTRHRLSGQHHTRYISKRNTVLYEATNVDRGITVVDYPVDAQTDRGEGRFTFEDDATLYISAEADNPMQVWTTLALTLGSERTFEEVLTRKRLDEHDVLEMLHDAPDIFYSMRNIGWVHETVADYDVIAVGKFIDTDHMNEQIKRVLSNTDINESNTSVVLNIVTENRSFELDVNNE